MGLLGATGVGIGAIVGGGILVLAGVAFKSSGPGAILAFALNGAIALLTASSFAEMSAAFPESGGTYTFAKKVLSVRAAFAVGWILWFAYIVAGVLYALGFAEYAAATLGMLWELLVGSKAPAMLTSRPMVLTLAVTATAAYTLSLIRKNTGGGQLATVGKVVVFVGLIAAGLWVLSQRPEGTLQAGFTPFLTRGAPGLLQAMGFTFIALQGFDLVAAIAGEVKDPGRTIPRAMFLSLGAALLIYLPLLVVVISVGVKPGQSISAMSEANPETVMAVAVANFLGAPGYWLVIVAAILSTLSALQANLLAASRVALTMARDRVLPRILTRMHQTRDTPVMSVYASALTLVSIMIMIPDLAAAGAAASLIFLISFALAHWTGALVRRRVKDMAMTYRSPLFPLVPVVGGVSCLGMALFQAVAVPAAGGITLIWLALGVLLYLAAFASRARAVDAFAEARDPMLSKLRGHAPLVLVPMANPHSAPALVTLADALCAPEVGRVLLLTVVQRPGQQVAREDGVPRELAAAQEVMGQALATSLRVGQTPEALMTIASTPWDEIARVAQTHRCESLLLGMTRLEQGADGDGMLEELLNSVECDVVVLRAPAGWQVGEARRILVPVGGKGGQDELRARLLGSLHRTAPREVTFLQVLPDDATDQQVHVAHHRLTALAGDESPGEPRVEVLRAADPAAAIIARGEQSDLVMLGMQYLGHRRTFGELALRIASSSRCASLMISHNS